MRCGMLLQPGEKEQAAPMVKDKRTMWAQKARILCKIIDFEPNKVRATYIKFCPQVTRTATGRRGINKADFRNGIEIVFKTCNFNQFSPFLNIASFSTNFKETLGWN